MGIVWEADLPQREKFVLLAYADHADHEGYNVFPSVGLIAWKTGYSERSIQRITKDLISVGILVEEGMSQYLTKRYRIMVNAIPRLSQYKGGVKVSPTKYGGDILSGVETGRGDKMAWGGDTAVSPGGDIAMSPKPSLTIIKPPLGGAVSILCKASGLSAFPADQTEWAEVLMSLVEEYGEEKAISVLKDKCTQWRNTYNKNGRPYRVTDLRWIREAQEALARNGYGDPGEVDTSKMTDKEFQEYLLKKGADDG